MKPGRSVQYFLIGLNEGEAFFDEVSKNASPYKVCAMGEYNYWQEEITCRTTYRNVVIAAGSIVVHGTRPLTTARRATILVIRHIDRRVVRCHKGGGLEIEAVESLVFVIRLCK